MRSRSVAVGRIDEDASCEFDADDVVRVAGPAVRAGYKPGRCAGLIQRPVRSSCASSAYASNGGASMTATSFLTCA